MAVLALATTPPKPFTRNDAGIAGLPFLSKPLLWLEVPMNRFAGAINVLVAEMGVRRVVACGVSYVWIGITSIEFGVPPEVTEGSMQQSGVPWVPTDAQDCTSRDAAQSCCDPSGTCHPLN